MWRITPHYSFGFHLSVELEKQSYCDLKVTNKTDQYVAFKVKTTSPKKYYVRPNTGVIQPWDSSLRYYSYQLNYMVWITFQCFVEKHSDGQRHFTLQAQREFPPDMQCKDKFLLQSTIVTQHTDVDELPSDTFNKDNGKVVEKCKLRVVYQRPNSALGNSENLSRQNSDASVSSAPHSPFSLLPIKPYSTHFHR
ncbi:membrane trafficking regulatory protein [Lithospermum erythrorhizon]|uniref:Membrane trafficking regulatory protein n=1 Tax=Lithospermum erythrorhizon TaxID=34254 RepID=A0AAV3RA78_LITER